VLQLTKKIGNIGRLAKIFNELMWKSSPEILTNGYPLSSFCQS